MAQGLPSRVFYVEEDGTRYAVQGYVNLLGLWYNAEILDEIGVEPPTTLEELEGAMAKAKEAGYMGITLSGLPNSQGEWQGYPWMTAEGFTYENLDTELREVWEHLGLPGEPDLPRAKGNARPAGHYRELYTPASRERVAAVFADTIEAFGYEF